MRAPFLLFDDSRTGTARLYQRPLGDVAAWHTDELRPAFEQLRQALSERRHVAGFLAYDACYGLEPKLLPLQRSRPGQPLRG